MMSLLHHQDETLGSSSALFGGRAESQPKERGLSPSFVHSSISSTIPKGFQVSGQAPEGESNERIQIRDIGRVPEEPAPAKAGGNAPGSPTSRGHDLKGEGYISFSEEKKPRSFMIHGELVALTGDLRTGAILGQLFYWSQKVTDLDLYLKEEKNVSSFSKDYVYQYGWFCKTLAALMEETMLRVSPPTMRNYLRFLTDRKWLQTRPCSQNKWGNYYRVNLNKLSHDLQKRGLSGFAIYERTLHSTQNLCDLNNHSSTGRTL